MANEAPKRDVLKREDAQFLQWARISASNKELLRMRDELVVHRDNEEINRHNVEQHERLQREAELLLRIVGYLILNNEAYKPQSPEDVEKLRVDAPDAVEANPDPAAVERIVRMGSRELNEVVGYRNHISTDSTASEWIFQMTK